VVQRLSADAEEATQAALKPNFRINKEEVRWITDMMDKHGDDFKVIKEPPPKSWL
jgi:hypothetical protein